MQKRNYVKNIQGVSLTNYKNIYNFFESGVVTKCCDNKFFIQNILYKHGFNSHNINDCKNIFDNLIHDVHGNTELIKIGAQSVKSGDFINQVDTMFHINNTFNSYKTLTQTFSNKSFYDYICNYRDSLRSDYRFIYNKYRDSCFEYKSALNGFSNDCLIQRFGATKIGTNYGFEDLNGRIIGFSKTKNVCLRSDGFTMKELAAINQHNCFIIEIDGKLCVFTMTSNKSGQVELLFRGFMDIDQYIRTDEIVIPIDFITSCNTASDPIQNINSIQNLALFLKHNIDTLKFYDVIHTLLVYKGVI